MVKQTGTQQLALLGGPRAVARDRRVLPWPRVTADDEAAVLRSLRSHAYTSASAGEVEISGLEREWADFAGTAYSVAVSNGTTALALALAAAGVQPGSEVVVPALSFVASAMAPVHLGATPVFADIDPHTFNLDPAAFEAAISPRTSAVVVVHLHGLPAELDEIGVIAARHGVRVVEDAAQAHGAQYRGRPVGTAGAANSFSLNVSKNLATCGEGGLVNTDDPERYRRIVMMRQFGEIIPQRSERSYVSHLLGWNYKPNAIQCAFTRSQLARLPGEQKIREENVRRLLGRVSALDGLGVPAVSDDRTHAWHILRFRVDPAAFGAPDTPAGPLRAVVMSALRAEGVPVSHYQLMPLPAQPAFRGVPGGHSGEEHPVTRQVIEDSFTIQKAHLHPDAGPLLDLYAEAMEKVWQHREVLVRRAAELTYEAPWQRAERIGAAEYGSGQRN